MSALTLFKFNEIVNHESSEEKFKVILEIVIKIIKENYLTFHTIQVSDKS